MTAILSIFYCQKANMDFHLPFNAIVLVSSLIIILANPKPKTTYALIFYHYWLFEKLRQVWWRNFSD